MSEQLNSAEWKMLESISKKNRKASYLEKKFTNYGIRLSHLLELGLVILLNPPITGTITEEFVYTVTPSGKCYLADHRKERAKNRFVAVVKILIVPIIVAAIAAILKDSLKDLLQMLLLR